MFTAKSMRRITNRARQKEYKKYDKFVKKAIKDAAKNKMFCVIINPELISSGYAAKLIRRHFMVEYEGSICMIYW